MPELRILSPDELQTRKGISFSTMHRHRLVKAGKFPKPIKLGDLTNGWVESEIDEWLLSRMKDREKPSRVWGAAVGAKPTQSKTKPNAQRRQNT